MKICTDDEYIEVDPNDVGELEAAMLFKAEHIKAKADPELFAAVAEMLSCLWDSATKRVDVVRCRECKYHEEEGIEMVYCPNMIGGWVENEWFCANGKRKEGAD